MVLDQGFRIWSLEISRVATSCRQPDQTTVGLLERWGGYHCWGLPTGFEWRAKLFWHRKEQTICPWVYPGRYYHMYPHWGGNTEWQTWLLEQWKGNHLGKWGWVCIPILHKPDESRKKHVEKRQQTCACEINPYRSLRTNDCPNPWKNIISVGESWDSFVTRHHESKKLLLQTECVQIDCW